MLIEEYEIESSRIVKYEQSEEEIALRTAKKKLLYYRIPCLKIKGRNRISPTTLRKNTMV